MNAVSSSEFAVTRLSDNVSVSEQSVEQDQSEDKVSQIHENGVSDEEEPAPPAGNPLGLDSNAPEKTQKRRVSQPHRLKTEKDRPVTSPACNSEKEMTNIAYTASSFANEKIRK